MTGDFYSEKSDLEIARHINLALLLCNGISDEDAGFDTITTINDVGLAQVARIVGEVRAAANAGTATMIRERINADGGDMETSHAEQPSAGGEK